MLFSSANPICSTDFRQSKLEFGISITETPSAAQTFTPEQPACAIDPAEAAPLAMGREFWYCLAVSWTRGRRRRRGRRTRVSQRAARKPVQWQQQRRRTETPRARRHLQQRPERQSDRESGVSITETPFAAETVTSEQQEIEYIRKVKLKKIMLISRFRLSCSQRAEQLLAAESAAFHFFFPFGRWLQCQ